MDLTKKPVLVYFISEFVYGSKVRQLEQLLNCMSREFECHIAALEVGDEAMSYFLEKGVAIHQIRFMPPRKFSMKKWIQFIFSPLLLNKLHPDIVHSVCYQSQFIEPLIVKLFTRSQYIYTKSNLQWSNHKVNWALKSMLSDCIISLSSATDELLFKKCKKKKIKRIPLGIDSNIYIPSPQNKDAKKLIIGCAAQIIKTKRILELVLAFSTLLKKYNNIELRICGRSYNDDYFKEFNKAISQPVCRKNIKYIGNYSDMPSFYNSIDLFVLPTVQETFGYVFIEAMSCGVPVICPNILGPSDIVVSGKTGLLINEHFTNEELVSAIESYILDQKKLKLHGKMARSRVESEFSTDIMCLRHKQLYRSLL